MLGGWTLGQEHAWDNWGGVTAFAVISHFTQWGGFGVDGKCLQIHTG